ncbi:MAG: LCP family protein [Solirubrobacteraceae bacterium]|nr:LCP family protein [Solirubrobacteraceae bacterium]
MPPPENPDGAPDYRVYRSRKPLLRKRAGGDRDELARLRGEAQRAPARPPQPGSENPVQQGQRPRRLLPQRPEDQVDLPRRRRRISFGRVVRWLVLAVCGWIVLSGLVFLVSAQIQQGKVSDANPHLGGAGYPAWSPNNILVLGSDVRSGDLAEPGAQTSGNGRSDSILLLRIGGGANSRLSIARDTVVDIPGAGRQKINAAYSIGGASLAVQTIEQYTGIDIHHVMLVSFEEFPQLIDAMGGIKYTGSCVVSRINGGFRNGGYTLRLPAGTSHIDGKQALALARTRSNDCAPNENDLTRVRRQAKIVSSMKRRLLSPMAFVRLPLISWNIPKALRSDMSGPTLLGLFTALTIAGSPQTEVLGTVSGQVTESDKQAKVRRFLAG